MARTDPVTLTRRRLLGGVLVLGGASAGAGAGTMSYFTDAATSENDVVAGTLTLSYGDTGDFSFSTALAPTASTGDSITLVSDGSLAGTLAVDVEYVEHDVSQNTTDVSAADVAGRLEVTTLTYGDTDLTDRIDASSSPLTLADLATNGDEGDEGDDATEHDLVDLADPGSGTDFTVEFRLENVDDDYQGDGVSVTVTFTLDQTDGT